MNPLAYKVCAEQNYPLSGVKTFEWNYYTVIDEALMPSDWATMSTDDKAFYLNESTNCHWVKGWVECDDERALAILVADNRTSDIGRWDEQGLIRLAVGLEDVEDLKTDLLRGLAALDIR